MSEANHNLNPLLDKAVIILMLWLYIAGLVILVGSEINVRLEHYRAAGQRKGEQQEGERREGGPGPKPAREGGFLSLVTPGRANTL